MDGKGAKVKNRITAVLMLLIIVVSCTGCDLMALPFGNQGGTGEEQTEGTGFVEADAGRYDSEDAAVVVAAKDEAEGKITLLNTALGKRYTLKYDGATTLFDKYGQHIAMSQVELGDIVDINFMKLQKRLNSLQKSPDAWSFENVKKFVIGQNNQSVKMNEENYKLYDKAVILSEGGEIDVFELNERDTLVVKGIDHTIYSITVDKGHGYLRLANETYFIGGWIEVGKLIQPVTEDMLLTVPEGTYQVLLSNKGIEGNREVTILRDGEVELDLGDIQPQEKRYGKIAFSITPVDASLYIDGEKQDSSQLISLEYGIHQMIVKADGHKTITQYLKVGKDMANIDVELESTGEKEESSEENSEEDEETTDNGVNSPVYGNDLINGTTSSNNTVATPTAGNRVYIDAPKGAEVYVDGTYVGVAPTSFLKVQGSHIVSLRMAGFQTKSYTIDLDKELKDISYTFSDLERS